MSAKDLQMQVRTALARELSNVKATGMGYSGGATMLGGPGGKYHGTPAVRKLLGHGVPLHLIQQMAELGLTAQFRPVRKAMDSLEYDAFARRQKRGKTAYNEKVSEFYHNNGFKTLKETIQYIQKHGFEKPKQKRGRPRKVRVEEEVPIVVEPPVIRRRSKRLHPSPDVSEADFTGYGRRKRQPSARNMAIGKLMRQGMSMAEANAAYKQM